MTRDDRYSRGKIYKLVSDMTDLIYIGSCCKPLSKRLCEHKSTFNTNGTRLTKSSELFKLGGKVEIILIEEYPCSNKMELEKRERYHIENNVCVNKRIPGRTQKEYREANRDVIAEYQKEYRDDNRDVLLEKKKEYYEANRDMRLEYQKEYRKDNCDVIAEKMKEYYEANRDTVSERNKERVKCPHCEKEMNRSSLLRHIKSQHPDGQRINL